MYIKKQDAIDLISDYFLLLLRNLYSQGLSTKHAIYICTFIINHIEFINRIILLI